MNSRITICTKLIVGLCACLLSLAILSITSLSVTSTLGESLQLAVNSTGKKLTLIGDTRQAFQQLKKESTQAQIAYAIAEMDRHTSGAAKGACSACHSPSPVEESIRAIEAAGKVVKDHNAEMRGLLSDGSSRAALDTFDRGASAWIADTKEYLRLANSQKFDDAHEVLRDKMFPILIEVEKASQAMAEREKAALNALNLEAQTKISRGRWLVLLVIGGSVIGCIGLFFVVCQVSTTLRMVVKEMSAGADQMSLAAARVLESSQSLAQDASSQAASMEETSASSEEITAMAHRNSDNSRHATSIVMESQKHFAAANSALDELQAAMQEINSSSSKISQIIRVIEEIAFQTNILALNAAVEAARAGQAGQGFAVVAEEVRNLAQRCARAASDTTGLIEESIANSNQGREKAERVGSVIRLITEQSSTIRRLVEEVTQGSHEQTQGVDEVTRALTTMGQVTQTTAASADQCATAGREMSVQSETLKALIDKLRGMVDNSFEGRETTSRV